MAVQRRKPPTGSVLIVFTDEKGSTERDEQLLTKLLKTGANQIRSRMLKSRDGLFVSQLQSLKDGGWTVVKNVGDALILRAELPPVQPAIFLTKRLEELYRTWITVKSTKRTDIRIAVHCAPKTHFVGGQELSLKEALDGISMPGLEEFFSALTLDLFGPGINRAARLASVPTGPLFVVSDEVISVLRGDMDTSGQDTAKSYFAAGRFDTMSRELPSIYGPIPLLHVKGIESVGMNTPWWVWEIPFRNTTKRRIETQRITLAAENKRLQMIRIVNVALSQTFTLGDRANGHALLKELENGFERHIDKNPQLKFYIDLCINVEDVICMYSMSDERKFDTQSPRWHEQHNDSSRFLPFYVALTSSRDVATDNILREQGLKPTVTDPKKASFQPLTYQIHNQMVISGKPDVAEFTKPSRHLYLFLFQIKDKHLGAVDDPDKFFDDIPPDCNMGKDRRTTLDIVLYGLIRGDKDGFLLLSAEREVPFTDLREFFSRAGSTDSEGFFSKFVTLKVYVGRAVWPMQEMNIHWLKSAKVS